MEITKETIITLGVAGFMQGYESVAGRALALSMSESFAAASDFLEGYLEVHQGDLLIAGSEFIALCWVGGRIYANNRDYETEVAPEVVRLMCEQLAQQLSDNDLEPAELTGAEGEV